MVRTVLQIPATPDHVRTARLIAAAAARQAELDEEQVDSIALATDEACILALGESADWTVSPGTNAQAQPREQNPRNDRAPDGRSLSIALESDDDGFAVEVAVANAESETRYDEVAAADPDDDIDPLSDRALTMTLIRAVVPEVVVEESTVGFAMRMSWPS